MWLNIIICRRNKNWFGIWFVVSISLVLVWFRFVIFLKITSLFRTEAFCGSTNLMRHDRPTPDGRSLSQSQSAVGLSLVTAIL